MHTYAYRLVSCPYNKPEVNPNLREWVQTPKFGRRMRIRGACLLRNKPKIYKPGL